MKLLILTNNPSRASFRQRIAVYLDALCKNGIDCEIAQLPANYIDRRRLYKRSADFDAVLLQKKGLNQFDAAWLSKWSKKVIYDFDDAIMYSTKAPDSDRSSHFRLFRRTIRLADMVIAGNAYLAEHAQRFNRNVAVLPTGLSTKAYRARDKQSDGKIRLVWIGSRSTLRYLLQIKPVLEEIGTRFDNVVLRLICDEFLDLENMPVEKCRWSSETEIPDLVGADIGLAPLADNRFTRGKCGFKILQYHAAGLPVVTSPVSVNIEYVEHGVTGYHASNADQWIERISELVESAQLREQIGSASREAVERFDIDRMGGRFCALVAKCLGESPDAALETILMDTRPARSHHGGKARVSVCIPTYNRKDYLRETIESILVQTYKDYEIVIVDDGSTDGTQEMIKSLGIDLTYHWQENAGDAAARNKLVELAGGEYISFIDSDDLLLPDAIERLVKAIEAETEDVVVYGSYFRMDAKGNVYSKCKRTLYSGQITEQLFQTIMVHSCGSMFPKKVLSDSPLFDTSLKICSDYDLWLRLSTRYRFVALSDPTFKRRRHPGNLSSTSYENCLTEFRVLERFYSKEGVEKIILEKVAKKVFGREASRTGRSALKEGLYDEACQLLGRSFRQYPNLKSLIHLVKATAVRLLKWSH